MTPPNSKILIITSKPIINAIKILKFHFQNNNIKLDQIAQISLRESEFEEVNFRRKCVKSLIV